MPEKTRKRCTGFSYIGPKLYNLIPKGIKEAKTAEDFKDRLKGYGRTSTNQTLTSIKIDKERFVYIYIIAV